tara:strand:- start:333 stop:590 length:258 start_codon:yes stop_codon:yes gene_type:complete
MELAQIPAAIVVDIIKSGVMISFILKVWAAAAPTSVAIPACGRLEGLDILKSVDDISGKDLLGGVVKADPTKNTEKRAINFIITK